MVAGIGLVRRGKGVRCGRPRSGLNYGLHNRKHFNAGNRRPVYALVV